MLVSTARRIPEGGTLAPSKKGRSSSEETKRVAPPGREAEGGGYRGGVGGGDGAEDWLAP